MITEIIRYQINLAEADEFIAAYRRALVIVDETGFALDWEILRQDDEPSLFQIIIRWKSKDDHMAGFRQAKEFADFFAHVKPYFSSILEMKHYSKL
jgi:heme-degrading monooxygenase HmoA